MSDPLPSAVDLAKSFEGFEPLPYQDLTGVWTIGYGSIWVNGDGQTPVTATTPAISEATACVWLANEMRVGVEALQAEVGVPLTTGERAALEDFIFNLGVGNFRSSTLLRDLNSGNFEAAAAQIDLWDHAGGKVVAGLLRRRQAETNLFLGKAQP
jgi:lysozyme